MTQEEIKTTAFYNVLCGTIKSILIDNVDALTDKLMPVLKPFIEDRLGKLKQYEDVLKQATTPTIIVQNPRWHDAQGDDLPPIDKEVIVLCDDGCGGYKVCFGHRPVESYTGISITNHSEMEEYYPERYGKGEWNIPNVKWWLDVELPNKEEQQ